MEGRATEIINLIVPGIAVVLSFVVQILIEMKNHKLNTTTATDAATTLAIYLACIAAVEILSVYEPAISSFALPIASSFALAEIYSVVQMIAANVKSPAVKAAAKMIQADLAGVQAAPANQVVQAGSDPFGAVKK